MFISICIKRKTVEEKKQQELKRKFELMVWARNGKDVIDAFLNIVFPRQLTELVRFPALVELFCDFPVIICHTFSKDTYKGSLFA